MSRALGSSTIDLVLYKKCIPGGAVPVGPVIIMIGLSPFPGVKEFVSAYSKGLRLYAYNFLL